MTGAKRWMVWLGFAVLCVGCAALQDDLRRAEIAFGEARYEDAQTWLQALEKDLPHMQRSMRAAFYFLRGTTAFRLDDREQARHYLALAREESNQDASALRTEWKSELETMLQELSNPDAAETPSEKATEGSDGEVVPALSKSYRR